MSATGDTKARVTATLALGSPPKRVFFVVGEDSGDRLGASLAKALKAKHGNAVTFEGLAGEGLEAEGVTSIFDIEDIAVMGIGPVIARLPNILNRLSATVEAIVDSKPDLVVLIDSPDFTHRVAKRVRARAPNIPIVGWVSPSVWAWRPGRAAAMRAYMDHLLVLLPFEVEEHETLGGPPATYVGHPLADQVTELRPRHLAERPPLEGDQVPTVLILPGSRSGEISRLMPLLRTVTERAVELLKAEDAPTPLYVLPAVARQKEKIRRELASWHVEVELVSGEEAKREAFRSAHAAVAASGTVALELALAGIPTVIVYRLDTVARLFFRRFIKAWTIVLPNLILGRPVVREYVDEYARPELIARALASMSRPTPERTAQVEAFKELDAVMKGSDDQTPAERARMVVDTFLFPTHDRF
ncbi:MAG: lipid-A-disaccharide synthase [Cohaesibacteraceae bacterium]